MSHDAIHQNVILTILEATSFWQDHKELFRSDRETKELLENLNPTFFYGINKLINIVVFSKISILCDPAVDKMGNKNYSLFALLETIPNEQKDFKILESKINEFKSLAKPIINVRNKFISHFDRKENDLSVPYEIIDGCLESLEKIINEYESMTSRPITSVRSIDSILNVPQLLYKLKSKDFTDPDESNDVVF